MANLEALFLAYGDRDSYLVSDGSDGWENLQAHQLSDEHIDWLLFQAEFMANSRQNGIPGDGHHRSTSNKNRLGRNGGY